ncbi:MAG TPA: ATP-binding protein, partial [Parafilimonas sp.]
MQSHLKKAYCLVFISCLFFMCGAVAQEQRKADSLAKIYQQDTLTDTAKLSLLLDLSFNEIRDYKQGLKYAEDLISLSQQKGNNKYLRAGYFQKGTKERLLGNLDEALDAFFKSAELAKKVHNLTGEGDSYGAIGDTYSSANNHENAKHYYNEAIAVLRQSNDSTSLASALLNEGDELLKTKTYDSALMVLYEAKTIFDKLGDNPTGRAYSLGDIGMVYANTGKNNLAEKNINEAIQILEETQDYYPVCDYLISMSDVYLNRADAQTALKYALRSLQLATQYKLNEQVANADLKLSELYEKSGDINQAFAYYKSYIVYRDSINNINSVQKMADLRTAYEVSQKQTEVNLLNQQKRNQKILLISLGVILGLAVILLFVLLKNNQDKQKAYKILNKQKQETDKQKQKAEIALNELQVTQKQLIQSAKMASLGELTAGIAHEIQNPLNFVTNFSEVNNELIDDLQKEAAKGNINEIKIIAKDIKENEEKINHHGKRADAIVKGMLQHSRISTGTKELININAFCDEYLRLSYHGMRAKDKTFNADFKTDFDTSLGKINVVPQDIGRVLLNLFNNAFYAVNEKMKHSIDGYQPTVTVSTKKLNNKTEIKVTDNGNGIPQDITDKIFQPFFTTKPTGEGTGLGLSLSYDIIKAHSGDIKVKTKESVGPTFIIEIPVST